MDKDEPTLESNHGLVDTYLSRESVPLLEIGQEWFQKVTELEEGIMTILTPLLVFLVVVQVEKSKNQCEPVSLRDLCEYNSYLKIFMLIATIFLHLSSECL